MSEMTSDVNKRMATDRTLQQLVDAARSIAVSLAKNATGEVTDFFSLRNLLRSGLLAQVLQTGDQISVDKESGVYVTVTGGVTAATVDEEIFIAAVNSASTGVYEFVYDGAAWKLGEETAELSAYGISVTGTPAAEDAVVAHVQGSSIIFDYLGPDYDTPVNPDLTHSLPLLTRDVLLYNAFAFSSPQALYAVNADTWPDGIPEGTTLHITLDHGAYNNSTTQDDTYQFTTPVAVPVGGKIRHSAMGVYNAEASYTKDRITGGYFIIYDADYNIIANNVPCAIGSDGVSLGTATSCDPQYKSGSHVNFTQRNGHGSNRYAHSASRKWLNSKAAGAASGEIASWWYPSDEFDMPVRSTLPGFLHGLDPAFVACVGKVYKRTALSVGDGYGFEDTEELIFLPSMTEMNHGKNNNVTETTTDGAGNVTQDGPYPFYAGATNDDRIKVQTGTATARNWWYRSPYPANAFNERYSSASGALNNSYAHNAGGVVAGLNLI